MKAVTVVALLLFAFFSGGCSLAGLTVAVTPLSEHGFDGEFVWLALQALFYLAIAAWCVRTITAINRNE